MPGYGHLLADRFTARLADSERLAFRLKTETAIGGMFSDMLGRVHPAFAYSWKTHFPKKLTVNPVARVAAGAVVECVVHRLLAIIGGNKRC